MMVRHGLMLVGPTGGGKTVARNILQRALTILSTFDKDKKRDPNAVFIKLFAFYSFFFNSRIK